MLQEWLLSYGPKELFGESGVPNDAILSVIPKEESKRVMTFANEDDFISFR